MTISTRPEVGDTVGVTAVHVAGYVFRDEITVLVESVNCLVEATVLAEHIVADQPWTLAAAEAVELRGEVVGVSDEAITVELFSRSEQYALTLPAADIVSITPYTDPELRRGLVVRDLHHRGDGLWLYVPEPGLEPFLSLRRPHSRAARADLPDRLRADGLIDDL